MRNTLFTLLRFVPAILVWLGLRSVWEKAVISDLGILLYPTDLLVDWWTSTASVYSPELGYLRSGMQVTIDKTCSGFSLWSLAFLMLSWLVASVQQMRLIWRFVLMALAALVAYLFTICINSAGMICYLQIKPLIGERIPANTVHVGVGIFVHFFFLMLLYAAAERVLKWLLNRFPFIASRV
jgi:exosortase K